MSASWRKLERAAVRGNAEAQYHLAAYLATGDGVELDQAKAAYWYGRAAKRKHREAMYNLGFMYLLGEGVAKDTKRALKLIEEAAELGSADAAMLFADILLYGQYEMKRDSERAALVLLRTFASGNSRAPLALGLELMRGRRLTARALSRALIEVAAEAGHLQAKSMLKRLRQ